MLWTCAVLLVATVVLLIKYTEFEFHTVIHSFINSFNFNVLVMCYNYEAVE